MTAPRISFEFFPPQTLDASFRLWETVQVLAPLSPESTIGKFLERSGPGLQQIAYRVEDIDAVSATLRRLGVRYFQRSSGSPVISYRPRSFGTGSAASASNALFTITCSPGAICTRVCAGVPAIERR